MAQQDSFFARVYDIVAQIPYGRATSYGQIARLLGSPRAARQVGWAMSTCPEELPWHRVVKADGSIAAGLLNMSLREQVVPLDMDKLGLECKWMVRDVWRQAYEGIFLGSYQHLVPGHATHLVRLIPTHCGHLREGLDDIRDNAWRLLMKRDGAPQAMLKMES